MNPLRTRDPALDITRCFALLMVLTHHFMLYNGFLTRQLIGGRMYLLSVMLSASAVDIGLFMMLSGYLMYAKRPTKAYFSKIGKTIWIYVLASITCYIYMRLTNTGTAKYGTLSELLMMILSFEAAPYSWYIEMYLGLFFLIPYLNLAYQQLETKRAKQIMILVFVCLSSLPNLISGFTYSLTEGFQLTAHSDSHFRLLPQYWLSLYPVTFYLCGVYLREYPLKLTAFTRFLAAAAAVILVGTVSFFLNYGDVFYSASWQRNGNLLFLIESIFVFNFLIQIDGRKIPRALQRILAKLSDWSLGAYLVSWLCDNFFYQIMTAIEPNPVYNIAFYPLVITAIFLCSSGISAVLYGIYGLLCGLFSRLAKRFPQRCS